MRVRRLRVFLVACLTPSRGNRLTVNDNPRSALYHALSTVQDIDGVSEDF